MSYTKEIFTPSAQSTAFASDPHHSLLSQIKQAVRAKLWLDLVFASLAFVLLFFFFTSFVALALGRESAFLLALFFTALFFYLMLRLHFIAKKDLSFEALVNQFLNVSVHGESERYGAIATKAKNASHWLEGKEKLLFSLPQTGLKILQWASQLFLHKTSIELASQLSAWIYWKDCLRMQELFFERALTAHIELVKINPTQIASHQALASSYMLRARLYGNLGPDRLKKEYLARFQEALLLAVEELTVLSDYAPEESSVHVMLAQCYRDLDRKEDEIHEREILVHLEPENTSFLFDLGFLYFQRAKNAKALKLYERLKAIDPLQAERLIKHYGRIESSSKTAQ